MNPAPGALERTHKLPQGACFIRQDSEAQGEKLTEGTQQTEEQEDEGSKGEEVGQGGDRGGSPWAERTKVTGNMVVAGAPILSPW